MEAGGRCRRAPCRLGKSPVLAPAQGALQKVGVLGKAAVRGPSGRA